MGGWQGWWVGLKDYHCTAMYPLCLAECIVHIIFWLNVFAYKLFINVWKIFKVLGIIFSLASGLGRVHFLNYFRSECVIVSFLLIPIFYYGRELQMQGFLVLHERCALLA